MGFFRTLPFLIALLVLIDGLILECTYSVKTVWVESYYHCQAKIIVIGHESDITDVSRNHLAGYSNINVSSIEFSQQLVKSAPRNIEAFFPNLAQYRMLNTQTEIIHPNDINKFPLLKYYLCQTNPKVNKVPPNMFADNPNLVGIGLNGGNKIQHVAYEVFDHLDKLAYLHIDGCVALAIGNSRSTVEANLYNIFKGCPPTLDMLNEQLSQRNCYCGSGQ